MWVWARFGDEIHFVFIEIEQSILTQNHFYYGTTHFSNGRRLGYRP
jgi:hypothetical protein